MEKRKVVKRLIVSLFILVLILLIVLGLLMLKEQENQIAVIEEPQNSVQVEEVKEEKKIEKAEEPEEPEEPEEIDFDEPNNDYSFLKLNNKKENKVYSPLSIKYTLNMLKEGTTGEAEEQISKLLTTKKLKKYKTNKNMTLANSLFVRDALEDGVKKDYIDLLKNNYNAEVIFDSFESPDNINKWIGKNTFNLINNIVEEVDQEQSFFLVNALAIDMEWKNKFLDDDDAYCEFKHENFNWHTISQIRKLSSFQNDDEDNKVIAGMKIQAFINNYDIINELGEENIRETVGEDFTAWAKELEENSSEARDMFDGDLSDENIEKVLKEFLDGGYIKDLGENYGMLRTSTDFSVYTDENVKVFAKDLKSYNGTTLQYVGIMPINEDIDSYIENIDNVKINNIIKNLKEVKSENFKQGVLTKIVGFIPKFNFDYQLKLKDNLEELGVTNVFEQGNANLTNIIDDENVYISDALHKAKIEFTQNGITAAAASVMAGAGGGGYYDYFFDIPVEVIDLTFDKPYMFLIRDVKNNETWFTGTVYNPLPIEEDQEYINHEQYIVEYSDKNFTY